MRLMFAADIHLHNFKDFSSRVLVEWDSGSMRYKESIKGDEMNTRLLDILNALCDARDYAVENNISYLLIAGDIFHSRATMETTVINAAHRIFSTFKKKGISVIAIAGNHDQVDSSICPESALRSLSEVMTVIEYPTLLELWDGETRVPIAAIPYSKDKTHVMNAVSNLLKENQGFTALPSVKPILLAHAGVDGGKVGSGLYSMRDTYSLDDFQPDKFLFAAFGHYHRPQMLRRNAFYCGSIAQNDFGDERTGYNAAANNGVWVGNTSNGDFEFVHMNAPRFITVSSKEELEKYEPRVRETAHVRIRSTLKASEEIRESLSEIGNAETPKMEIEQETKEVVRSGISIQLSPADAVRVYAKENNADDDTLALGLEILGSVMK